MASLLYMVDSDSNVRKDSLLNSGKFLFSFLPRYQKSASTLLLIGCRVVNSCSRAVLAFNICGGPIDDVKLLEMIESDYLQKKAR